MSARSNGPKSLKPSALNITYDLTAVLLGHNGAALFGASQKRHCAL
jgi:hypothetical protein